MKLLNVLLTVCAFAFASYAAVEPQVQPEPTKRVNPEYPRELLSAGVQGSVFVRATISEQGKVENAVVIKSTDKRFDEAALEAVKQWEFKPATLDGKPIRTEVTIPMKFAIKESSAYPGKLKVLRDEINRFLEGGSATDLLPHIDSSAYGISGKDYEHLMALLKVKSKADKFGGIHGTKILFSDVRTDAASSVALFTVNTESGKSERFHTILCAEQPDKSWKIVSWHVSP